MRKNGESREAVTCSWFREKILKKFPNAFYHKLPDTFGLGGMRPFDAFAIVDGTTFVFEFKRGWITKVTDYQQYNLNLASQNGAYSMVINERNREATMNQVEDIVNANRK